MIERLTAKVGPLPVWAWALLGLVGIFLVSRFVGGSTNDTGGPSSSSSDGSSVSALDSDTTPVGADTGSPPAASGMGSSVDNMSDGVYAQLGGLQGSVDALTAAVQLSPAFWGWSDAGAGAIVPSDGSKVPAPATATKTQAAPTVAKTVAKPKPAATPAKPAAPTKFYTYKPGAAPKGKKAQEAPARGPAGTSLRFKAGRGYYYG